MKTVSAVSQSWNLFQADWYCPIEASLRAEIRAFALILTPKTTLKNSTREGSLTSLMLGSFFSVPYARRVTVEVAPRSTPSRIYPSEVWRVPENQDPSADRFLAFLGVETPETAGKIPVLSQINCHSL